MQKIWLKIQAMLENSLAPGQGKVWLAPLIPSQDEEGLVLHASSAYMAEFVRSRFLRRISEAASQVMGENCKVKVCSLSERLSLQAGKCPPASDTCPGVAAADTNDRAAADKRTDSPVMVPESAPARRAIRRPAHTGACSAGMPEPDAPQQQQDARPAPRPLSSLQLALPMRWPSAEQAAEQPPSFTYNRHFSFEDFVVGPCNELAYAAAHSICSDGPSSDTLLLASAPGLGKTHLMQAVGKVLSERCNRARPKVEYLTAEEFVSRFWLAIKGNETDRFKSRYRDLDLLLLEDVHFFQGKDTMQAELLATVKALQAKGSKIVFTSSFLPKDLRKMDEQLHSRLSSGLFSFIDRPDEDTRRRILRSKAALHQVILPEDVEAVLARHISSDVRKIESCLRTLALKARLYNCAVSMQMAVEVLADYADEMPVINLDMIIDQVCRAFALTRQQLCSAGRRQECVCARNTAFLLARRHTSLSLEAIGQVFNRRHSTVIKGLTACEREMTRETPLGRQIAHAVAMVERNSAGIVDR